MVLVFLIALFLVALNSVFVFLLIRIPYLLIMGYDFLVGGYAQFFYAGVSGVFDSDHGDDPTY